MTNPLFIEIDKFDDWAQAHFDIPQDDIGGEWECDYHQWDKIYSAFEAFIAEADTAHWNDIEKDRLLYIIARDNEAEYLAGILPEQALSVLSKHAIKNGHRDDKWQLATNLNRLSDKQLAATLLELFVEDEDEYVSRRALMELASVHEGKIEHYAELFWNRNKYDDDEYQRMAVLDALKTINSKQLDRYIKMAKEDGRQYLVANAIKLERE